MRGGQSEWPRRDAAESEEFPGSLVFRDTHNDAGSMAAVEGMNNRVDFLLVRRGVPTGEAG